MSLTIEEACIKLNNKECLILPSDTLYGLAARAYDNDAIEKIFEIKNRPEEKKLPIHYSSLKQMENDIEINPFIEKLAKHFWPGALTIVTNKKPTSQLQKIEKTVGIRIPNHAMLLKIIEKTGPICMPSANRSNETPFNQFHEIQESFQKHGINLNGISDDIAIGKTASTIIEITNTEENLEIRKKPTLLRSGSIAFEEILSVWNTI